MLQQEIYDGDLTEQNMLQERWKLKECIHDFHVKICCRQLQVLYTKSDTLNESCPRLHYNETSQERWDYKE